MDLNALFEKYHYTETFTSYKIILKLYGKHYLSNGKNFLHSSNKSMDLFTYGASLFSADNYMNKLNIISYTDIKSLENYMTMMQAKITDPRFTEDNAKKTSENYIDPANSTRWLTEKGHDKLRLYIDSFINILRKYPDSFEIIPIESKYAKNNSCYSDDFQVITQNVGNT